MKNIVFAIHAFAVFRHTLRMVIDGGFEYRFVGVTKILQELNQIVYRQNVAEDVSFKKNFFFRKNQANVKCINSPIQVERENFEIVPLEVIYNQIPIQNTILDIPKNLFDQNIQKSTQNE
ncbi:unnamed protein product (macronuclear) [Paramecium tetraurelia]|uniref:Uncharacterized protein n=1 Tax=Paramecium tetraurelia TaxID=5888 RepID=A0D774_PARTE|nr:uncharacterized protein GSPATT00001932001 [Paramecium tetraurelia]CAK78891.1 unnamed protein product [Paramecium tetraurelia]|eukprot:XP_001446288.1 hypothetical protein (macronuclear) [Paramecium tetraurelia strain d4-2]